MQYPEEWFVCPQEAEWCLTDMFEMMDDMHDYDCIEGDEYCGFYDDAGNWIEYEHDDFEHYTMDDWVADNCMEESTDPMCDALMNFPEW